MDFAGAASTLQTLKFSGPIPGKKGAFIEIESSTTINPSLLAIIGGDPQSVWRAAAAVPEKQRQRERIFTRIYEPEGAGQNVTVIESNLAGFARLWKDNDVSGALTGVRGYRSDVFISAKEGRLMSDTADERKAALLAGRGGIEVSRGMLSMRAEPLLEKSRVGLSGVTASSDLDSLPLPASEIRHGLPGPVLRM